MTVGELRDDLEPFADDEIVRLHVHGQPLIEAGTLDVGGQRTGCVIHCVHCEPGLTPTSEGERANS